MERKLFIPVLFVILIVVAAAIVISSPGEEETNDRIYQIGTLQGLMDGDLDGKIAVGELLDHGSYGLGTFEGLNGEMIVIDGVCYQVLVDGSVNEVPDSTMTPFASVTDLSEDKSVNIGGQVNYSALKERLLASLEDDGAFCMFVVHGTYSNVTVRSVPGKSAPYPSLADIIAEQNIFYLNNVTGTLIGFYSPSFIGTVDQSGFHFHFISDDRTEGGHVLDMELENITVTVDVKNGLELDL